MGIPTANIPIEGLEVGGHKDVESGVYFGWAGISLSHSTSDAALAAKPKGSQEAPTKNLSGESSQRDRDSQQRTDSISAGKVYPMVMSIGWNPFYKNEVRSVEVHIIHKFDEDFYNALMNLSILGFIRPEQDYASMQDLIDDINTDIEVARESLRRPPYAKLNEDSYLLNFGWGNE